MIKINVIIHKVQDFILIKLKRNAKYAMNFAKHVKEVQMYAHHVGISKLMTKLMSFMKHV